MKKSFKFTIAWLIICLLLVGVTNGQQASHNKLKKNIKTLLEKWNSEKEMGIAVLVGHEGKIIYHSTVGLRNRARNEKIKKKDLFEYASVSKQFTASVILMLEQNGKLTVDDSVHWYIQSPYKNITIRHLLQHTSGLPDYQQVMSMFWDKSKIADNNDILEYLNKYQPPILFQPGATYEYSNTGYIFLASIAEKASGKDFRTLLDSGIFVPSKMKTAALRTPAERSTISNFTKGYVWNQPEKRYQSADSMIQFNYTIWLGNRKGPGRVSGSLLDLWKWDQALRANKVLTQASQDKAFTPAKLNSGKSYMYGFGWDIEKHPKLGRIVSHNGDNPGFKSQFIRYLDAGYTIIVLTNHAHPHFDRFIQELTQLIGH